MPRAGWWYRYEAIAAGAPGTIQKRASSTRGVQAPGPEAGWAKSEPAKPLTGRAFRGRTTRASIPDAKRRAALSPPDAPSGGGTVVGGSDVVATG